MVSPKKFIHSIASIIWGVFLLTLLTSLSSRASIPFQPDESPTIIEAWRWHELEPLRDYSLSNGVEADDGTLWFATDKGLLSYDGFECQEYPYPEEFGPLYVCQLFFSKNGLLYLYSSIGAITFDDGNWENVLEIVDPMILPSHRIASSKYGVEFFATAYGVYQLIGYDFVRQDQVPPTPLEIAIDGNNKLWLTNHEKNRILSFQLDTQGIADPAIQREYTIPIKALLYQKIVAGQSSKDVWAVNWRQNVTAFRYTSEDDKWTPYDLKSLSGTNLHSGGFRVDEDNLLLFSKTNLALLHKDNWYSIEYPEFQIPTNKQFAILRKNGQLVICGQGEPAYEIDFSSNQWETHNNLHFQCETNDKRMWYISLEGEIIEHNTVYDTWHKHIDSAIDTPTTLMRSDDDFIWAAGSHKGLPAVSYFNGQTWTRNLHPELNQFISHLSAKQLSNGDILFGSSGEEPTTERHGLVRYRKSEKTYEFDYISKEYVPARIASIAETPPSKLWFAGLQFFSSDNLGNTPPELVTGFENDEWVDDIATDSSNNLWIGIWNRGLFQFDGETWIHHTEVGKIASDQVVNLLADKKRNDSIWIATNKGISRHDGENWFPFALPVDFRLNRESGMLKQSNDGSIWVNFAKREWYFRKTTGFKITKKLYDTFKTIRYRLDETAPTVRIDSQETEFTAPANVYVKWSGTDKWSLTPENEIRFSYRLNDGVWSAFDRRNDTTLLDIPRGEHLFQVRSMDADGNISALPAQTILSITPPLWLRPWFIIVALLLIATIITLTALLFRQRIKHIVQLEEFKIQFFTNISHELRTPLTVILGPLETQLAKLPESLDKGPLKLAYKNAQKMLHLIDQILDFRSAELGNIKLNYARADLISVIQDAVHLIQPLAEQKQQKIIVEMSISKHIAWFDSEKLEKIISNLLSNAIKYTQPQGTIRVFVEVLIDSEPNEFRLIVEDNGQGIPHKKIDSIFEVFYRVENKQNSKIRGSGIGLSYTKNLVEAFAGSISVDSPITTVNEVKQGTRFIVSLPLKNTPDSADETNIEITADIQETSEDPLPDSKKALILIAEDDSDIREFLSHELQDSYEVRAVADGEEAWQQVSLRIPDILITDVMMPHLNGRELCKRIKENEATCHIPIIMLTALKSHDHELEGLEAGANDYLAKPIHIHILKQRIHNQLESQNRLQKRYQSTNKTTALIPSETTSNPLDERFMKKAIAIVEEHMADALFDIERFSKLMGMSRMTLYRKFKAITGESPSAFIRTLRLNKAAELLTQSELNVSEVSDLVGVSDLSYFGTLFKKRFKVSPTQYKAQQKAAD